VRNGHRGHPNSRLTGAFAQVTAVLDTSVLQYNRLQSAVAQGARFASLIPYDSPTIAPSTAFLAGVHNMTLYGSPTAGTSPVVRGITPGNVSLTVTFTNGVPSAMTVSISGYIIDSVFRKTTLSNKPRVTYPYQGIWTPL